MGCLNPAKLSAMLLAFTDGLAVLVDYKPVRSGTYTPGTGAGTLASPTSIPDVKAMIQWDQAVTKGSDYFVDKNEIVVFIAYANISIEPSPNDRFEYPAASVRGAGTFRTYVIRSVDKLRGADVVLGYALRASL